MRSWWPSQGRRCLRPCKTAYLAKDMRQPKVIAYHVGRSGEVAGGMTQVINSYLSWDFPGYDLRVITSRGSSSRPGAALMFARALGQVLFTTRVKHSVLVVHLSQGGSFVREGWILRAGRLRRFATVAQIHGSSFVEFAAAKPKLVSRVLSRAGGIHVLSEASASVAREMAPRSIVTVIPNAVAEGSKRDKSRSVVFAGAIGRRKGADLLAEAWSSDFADAGWSLHLAGPVSDEGVLPNPLPPSRPRARSASPRLHS